MKKFFLFCFLFVTTLLFAGGGMIPVNNNCSGALAFPAIPTDGTPVCLDDQSTQYATYSNVIPTGSCTSSFGTADDDIWFSFVATSASVQLEAASDWGSDSDVYWQVFSGNCASVMTAVLCTDNDAGGTITGLSIGNTYYIRMYSYYSGTSSQYDICLKSNPPPPLNDNCGGALAFPAIPVNGTAVCLENQSTVSASPSNVTPGGACTNNSGIPDDDIWFSFVASHSSIKLEGLYVSGNPDVEWQIYSGNCASGMNAMACIQNDAGGTIYGLSIGTSYRIRLYSFYSSVNSVYTVCLKANVFMPPSNDECSGAINLVSSTNINCSDPVNGTVEFAQASAQANGCNGGVADDDDVWYKFTATDTSHRITLSNISGTTDDLFHAVYSGSCSAIGTPLICQENNESALSGLTPGHTYYVRVYTSTSSSSQTTIFTICLTRQPPFPANSDCLAPTLFCPFQPVDIASVPYGNGPDGNNYGCLVAVFNPYWYYFEVESPGRVKIDLTAANDIDFALYGPFSSLDAVTNTCGSLPNPIDCNSSGSNVESADVANAQAGEFYLLLLTNYAGVDQHIYISSNDPVSDAVLACNSVFNSISDISYVQPNACYQQLGSVTLNSMDDHGTLYWNGAMSDTLFDVLFPVTIQDLPVGDYHFQYDNGSGTDSFFVVLHEDNVLPAPTVSTSGPDAFCAGDSLILSSSVGSGNEWSTGETTSTITVHETGYYYVFASQNNCISDTSNRISITVHTNPEVTLSAIATNICNVSSPFQLTQGSPPNGTYYVNGQEVTEFDPSTALTGDNTVTYVFQDMNGCSDSASQIVVVGDCAFLAEHKANVFTIFPNPASSEIHISGKDLIRVKEIVLYDYSGRIIQQFEGGKTNLTIDLSGLANGIYTIILQGNDLLEIQKIEVIK